MKAQEQIDKLIDDLDNASLRLHSVIEHGDADRIILEQEEMSAPDMVVIGKHGESVMREMLFGSVARHVLSYSRCDVLVANE